MELNRSSEHNPSLVVMLVHATVIFARGGDLAGKSVSATSVTLFDKESSLVAIDSSTVEVMDFFVQGHAQS